MTKPDPARLRTLLELGLLPEEWSGPIRWLEGTESSLDLVGVEGFPLWAGARIEQNLYVDDTSIPSLPADLWIGAHLYCSGEGDFITPSGLRVEGELYSTRSGLTFLSPGSVVLGRIVEYGDLI